MKTLSNTKRMITSSETRSFKYSVCPNCKSETLVKSFVQLGTKKLESCNCFMCGYENSTKPRVKQLLHNN